MNANQHHRNCSNFIGQINSSPEGYETIKTFLIDWKQKNSKSITGAIDTFMKIARTVMDNHVDLMSDFNKCLVKEAALIKRATTAESLKQMAIDHNNSTQIINNVYNLIKNDNTAPNALEKPPTTHPANNISNNLNYTKIEELSQQKFITRLERHPLSQQIGKIIHLYRKSIITLREFKSMLEPIYFTDPSAFNMLFQYTEETEVKRRKITIFAPLNELIDQKYPMEQVGNSYIIIPDGYANYAKEWKTNALENVMNRVCVSVPLGSEVAFVVMRKNEYEEQLFKNQEEKHEIDINVQCLKVAINKIEKMQKLEGPLLKRIISNIYPSENLYNIVIREPEVARNIILPRLKQKLQELLACRVKFEKQCVEIASKNFYKSLDYRGFYFKKNDKKFNCQQRWETEIQLRKKQIIMNQQLKHEEIEDRQAMQHSRNHIVNTFDNITKEEFIENKIIDFDFAKKQNSIYPRYPNNQILFVIDLSDLQVLNDVLQIVLYHCQKKSILELMFWRMFRSTITRKLQKDVAVLAYIESKAANFEGNENSNSNMPGLEMLNDLRRDKKIYKDINEEFHDLIEEEIDPACLQDLQSPFEGPSENTFIGTKQCYYFLRYILTIYQRFLRAKQLSEQRQCNIKNPQEAEQVSLYKQFLAILIYKLKEQKSFEEYLRKILHQQAFVFFTLDKLISGFSKLIGTIGNDSLTYKILKDETKDYELEIKSWANFEFPSITSQLTRISREDDMFFRFTYQKQANLVYVSSWENGKSNKDPEHLENTQLYLTEPVKINRRTGVKLDRIFNGEEYHSSDKGSLTMEGEFFAVNLKRASANALYHFERELCRLKRVKIN